MRQKRQQKLNLKDLESLQKQTNQFRHLKDKALRGQEKSEQADKSITSHKFEQRLKELQNAEKLRHIEKANQELNEGEERCIFGLFGEDLPLKTRESYLSEKLN